MEQSIEHTREDVREVQNNVSLLQGTIQLQAARLKEQDEKTESNRHENMLLKERQLAQDTYSRRKNLKFEGIPEESNEKNDQTITRIRNLFRNELGIAGASDMKFQRCHRMGYKPDRSKPRDVIVRFVLYPDREEVRIKVVVNLKIQRSFYRTVLPDEKSRDKEIFTKIRQSLDPKEEYYYGKKHSLDNKIWNNNIAVQVMEKAKREKFQQNTSLKQQVIFTGEKSIIHCNPHDLFWANGLKMTDQKAEDCTKWKGRNNLGKVLCNIRDSFK